MKRKMYFFASIFTIVTAPGLRQLFFVSVLKHFSSSWSFSFRRSFPPALPSPLFSPQDRSCRLRFVHLSYGVILTGFSSGLCLRRGPEVFSAGFGLVNYPAAPFATLVHFLHHAGLVHMCTMYMREVACPSSCSSIHYAKLFHLPP